jgi:iron complex transport system substrate-binding protein
LSLAASDFSGLYTDILSVGSATGQTDPAEKLVARLYQRIGRVIEQTALLDRPRVFCLSWFDPLMAAGGWINAMVKVAGGDQRLGGVSKASSRIDVRRIERESPEIVLIVPCSFSQERSAQEWIGIRDSSPWRDLPAVGEGRVFTLESSLFHRPGPRLIDGVELLAALIHPARCSFSAASDFSQKVA